MSYFEIQACMGTTKHMGGFEATKELIELCHVDGESYVLDVGCGVGATACYLARTYGCRVVGVDLRESMIARSQERAQKEGVAGRVEYRVADAQALPFEEGLFDAVLCESVATFVGDKPKMVGELARVTRPGGYVGLNEEFWREDPPPEMVEFAQHTWEIDSDLPTADGWLGLLEGAGLQDVTVRAYQVDARRESSQIKRYRWADMWGMFSRTLSLYLGNPAFRAYMKDRRRLPKGLFDYLGYGLFVGRT